MATYHPSNASHKYGPGLLWVELTACMLDDVTCPVTYVSQYYDVRSYMYVTVLQIIGSPELLHVGVDGRLVGAWGVRHEQSVENVVAEYYRVCKEQLLASKVTLTCWPGAESWIRRWEGRLRDGTDSPAKGTQVADLRKRRVIVRKPK